VLPGMELMGCPVDVPAAVMQHVVKVESSYNPYAIGVVGGHLVRQPQTLQEALATVHMLEDRGFNFSIGLAQVNRHNLQKYGLGSYAEAFQACPNLRAGSRILADCNQRASGHWGKSFSCYYSGNFVTGYREGYVQKIEASMAQAVGTRSAQLVIPVVGSPARRRASPRANASLRAPETAAPLAGRRVVTDTPAPAKPKSQQGVATAVPAGDSAFVF